MKKGMPVNMTKDVSKDFKNFFKDDLTKPPGTIGMPAFAPGTGFSKKLIKMNGGDSNFAGDNILEHSDRNIISPGG